MLHCCQFRYVSWTHGPRVTMGLILMKKPMRLRANVLMLGLAAESG